jgi:hypothetical protein
MPVQRSLDRNLLTPFLKDFAFLFKRICQSQGELDLRLRRNAFNLYYRGCSLAKVEMKMSGEGKVGYKVLVNNRFAAHVFSGDSRFSLQPAKTIEDEQSGEPERYLVFSLDSKSLHPFFQRKYLDSLESNITKANYGEEIGFEQMLITDNLNREELIVIDRQVTGGTLQSKRLDLLALERVGGIRYRFLALELKLGRNKELAGKVAEQLRSYVESLTQGFDEWKRCYEECYRQLRATGVFGQPSHKEIEIIRPVRGRVIVMGYSQAGQAAVRELRQSDPDIQVQPFVCKIA